MSAFPSPPTNSANVSRPIAVDYANPARIYVAIYADQSDLKVGITILVTTDSGASWRLVRTWPGSQRLALWTTVNGDLYVNDQRVPDSMEGKFSLSASRGLSWTEIKLPAGNEGLFFVGISGQRVITIIGSDIYPYTTATGVFTLIGSLLDLWYGGGVGDRAGIIVDAPSPAFIATSRWETAIRALPYVLALPDETYSRTWQMYCMAAGTSV